MWPQRLKTIPVIAAIVLAATATAVLVGWAFGIELLMTVFPGLIRMKINTAIAFLFAAAALYLASRRSYRRLQTLCSLLILALGLITLCEYAGHFSAGIDQLLAHDVAQIRDPGRMAPITAINFVLSGIMLFPFRRLIGKRIADGLAVIVCFGSTFAIVGYIYGVPMLYGSLAYTAMAIHTGFCFLVLSLAFLLIPRPKGLAQIFRAQTSGGIVARRLIPSAILIPLAVGAVVNRFNFGQLRLGIALVVVFNVLLVVACIWVLAHALDQSDLQRISAELASETDPVTGVRNRRYFDRRLEEEVSRCARYNRSSCLILFDLDYFKRINDEFGHICGDKVLKTVAQACQRNIRLSDILCRYGGEEFAVILPEIDAAEVVPLARKLRSMVETLHCDPVSTPITISLGIAEIRANSMSAEMAVAAADRALYAAKNSGRNRECVYDSLEFDTA